jgi:hypothetical protein
MAICIAERYKGHTGSPNVRRTTVGKMRSKGMMWDV